MGRIWLLILVFSFDLFAAEEPRTELSVPKQRCFLSVGLNGRLQIVEPPMLGLGMMASSAPHYIYRYRLNPELSERFSLLANRFGRNPSEGRPHTRPAFMFPHPEKENDPIIIVSLEIGAQLIDQSEPGKPDKHGFRRPATLTYEVNACRIIDAEFLTAKWRKAWERLDGILDDIVAEALKAPSEKKRSHLEQLIEEGSLTLNMMMTPRVTAELQDLVKGIEPEAKTSDEYQKEIASMWGRPLKTCIERLSIQPKTPLPPESEKWRVFYPPRNLDHNSFSSLMPNYGQETPTVILEEHGLVVRPLDVDMMAEKLVLGGLLIEKVFPEGEKWGLQSGDVIPTCRRVYDLVMNNIYGIAMWSSNLKYDGAVEWAFKEFLRQAKHAEGTAGLVIRGQEIVKLGGD